MAVAVNADEVAPPPLPVVATQLDGLGLDVQPVLPKVAEAPFAGAVKVTAAFGTGLPSLSCTVTASGLAKAADVLADCLSPEVAVS